MVCLTRVTKLELSVDATHVPSLVNTVMEMVLLEVRLVVEVTVNSKVVGSLVSSDTLFAIFATIRFPVASYETDEMGPFDVPSPTATGAPLGVNTTLPVPSR